MTTSKHRKWATGSSREERISDPSRGFTARFAERSVVYQCVNPKCAADVDGAALYCPDDLHIELRP